MAKPMPHEGDRAGPERASTDAGRPGVPRWVKIFGIVAALLLLLLIAMLASGGQHGPGRHRSSSLGFTAVAAPSDLLTADAPRSTGLW